MVVISLLVIAGLAILGFFAYKAVRKQLAINKLEAICGVLHACLEQLAIPSETPLAKFEKKKAMESLEKHAKELEEILKELKELYKGDEKALDRDIKNLADEHEHVAAVI